MVFHIDGNSFYASCERVFRPDLYKSPIAVLSNNDGIIVALNAECKALGFKRGDVFFQVKHRMEKQGVQVFSSNYTLYADMSARMNVIYSRIAAEVEVYSIDESFLFFPDWKNTSGNLADVYTLIGSDLKNTVTRETGIPVSIGIAPNKTLAKMCNKLAKGTDTFGVCPSYTKGVGVCNWLSLDQDKELANYPVGDIWGIGWSKTAFLKRHGIHTALDLKRYPLHKAKKHLTITGMRTVQELNGVRALGTDTKGEGGQARQVIMVSRSFQKPVYAINDIIAALAEYTQEAVNRMREGGLSCRYISVYLMTNAYAEGEQYCNYMTCELPYHSKYLPQITAAANEMLKRIYRPNYKYRKVMIGLTGLSNDPHPQLDLFENHAPINEPLMQAFDTINSRYGRGTLKLACGLVKKIGNTAETNADWQVKRDYLSPRYTTNINEIPVAF